MNDFFYTGVRLRLIRLELSSGRFFVLFCARVRLRPCPCPQLYGGARVRLR